MVSSETNISGLMIWFLVQIDGLFLFVSRLTSVSSSQAYYSFLEDSCHF